MSLRTSWTPRIAVLATIAALGGVITLGLSAGTKQIDVKPAAAKPASSVFPKLEDAKNPVTLSLQADERKVVGWISGTESYAGKSVRVKVGHVTELAKIDDDNTFTWKYTTDKPATAEVSVEKLTASVFLNPSITTKGGPSIFFIIDRTAYRPGQILNFAGFVRKESADGEFEPIANKEIEIDLVSQKKQTRAARLKLTSDANGRITGAYQFSENDALDNYTLSAKNYIGSATLMLGEYRKSKVRLKINGTTKDGQMTLKFEPVDFLEKPVVATGGSFSAQIVRKTKQKEYSLKAEDFVYHQAKPVDLWELTSLSEEDLLYREAEGFTAMNFYGLGNTVVSSLAGQIKPEGEKPGEHTFKIQPEWLSGDCEVVVSGVIVDSNGREQRATATIPITGTATEGAKPALELKLSKSHAFTGEPIEVFATGTLFDGRVSPEASLLVMKLKFQTPATVISPNMNNPYTGRMPSYRYRGRYVPYGNYEAVGTQETVHRSLVTAVPIKGCEAKVTLTEPGAYKLIAVVPNDKGGSTQKETTVVVKRIEDVNALVLRMDKDEYAAGDKLTGSIHSRFKDAKALLTLRDNSGIRFTKPISFKDGVYTLNEAIPAGLKYGCSIDVAYPDASDHEHIVQSFIRIAPKDRMLTVDVNTPTDIPPGSPVELELKVNRNEAVDLVVSVYDQSLLGIAADKSKDIRNFYLADVRSETAYTQSLLNRRLGHLKLSDMYKKADEMLKAKTDNKENKDTKLSAAELTGLHNLVNNRNSHYLWSYDLATMLRLAGVDIYLASPNGNGWYYHFGEPFKEGSKHDITLREVIEKVRDGWKLQTKFLGNTLIVHETHESYVNNQYNWHPVYGYNYGYGGYGYYGNQQLYLNSAFQDQWGARSGGMARGDAAYSMRSMNGGGIGGNSSHSFMPEGQAVLSHMPISGPVGSMPTGGPALIDTDAGQGHIMVRRDFSDSAYWNATVRTDENGKAKVSFKLPDSLTNWQVVVTAVSKNMHVGTSKASFRTFKPIMVWPMLPRTFTEGDKVEVFASVHNRTETAQKIKVKLKVENGDVLNLEEKEITVPAKSNAPVYWTFAPRTAGYTQLLMSADSPAGSDASLKRLPVVRCAAEQIVTVSGTVRDSATIELPPGFDPTAARLEIMFAPSLAADVADTLNYLVDYPYGCVEQTMSRFLPAIKVAQILNQFKLTNPALEKKLPGCVAGGIKRLLELQQPDGGWGWNGNGQTHEMFTPYALYGLLQAEKAGYTIPNEQAVNRGLDRLSQFIQNMGDTQMSDRVYCMYVFSHRRELSPEWWTWIETNAKAGKLSDYALALALEMAVDKKKGECADQLALKLKERVQKSGAHAYWETAKFSRWGDDKFEVTAVVMKALVAWNKDEPLIDNILSFFIATKRGDRWNSTKDTAMILYAMTDFLAKSQYSAPEHKTLGVTINGDTKKQVKFDDQLTQKIVIDAADLKPGKNVLKFDTKMSGVLYRAVFRYWKSGREIPAMEKGIQVKRTFHQVDDKGKILRELKNGDTIERGSYILSNIAASQDLPVDMRYVLVENPKPATGETIAADDPRFMTLIHEGSSTHVLREDREAMVATHFEQTGRSLQTRCVFLAELSGDFVVAPAHAELMYQTEVRGHSGSFTLKVVDKDEKK